MSRYKMIEGMVQEYDKYTAEDAHVWRILFERQMDVLPKVASPEYLEGIEVIGFNANELPSFEKVNARLKELTGWSLVVVPGIIEEVDFFPLLADRKFPATTWLRKMSELDYLSEPDMFHDVFGHVPLLSNQTFCDFFQRIGELGVQHLDDAKAVAMLGRLYWFTVEFGLIQAKGNEMKIYGAGILSSHGETKFSLSDTPDHIPFDAELILNTPYENDRIQDKYFVIESFEQLYKSMEDVEQILGCLV